ncbi:MAG: thiamine pyrophosphate-dependent dehydrogenase E1 component subunit alpha [Pseudomonadota bacterium]
MLSKARNLLGDLSDPAKNVGPIDVRGEEPAQLLRDLRMMLLIRRAEEKIGDLVSEGKAHCPCHLGIGEEAIAVGVSRHLRNSDRVFGAHRSHSHYLALGGELGGLMAEVLGKASGCSGGMGGSMHLVARSKGFLGSVPIVAGTIALAVGAGLAAKKDRKGDVGVVYFGDGAAEEGALHESLNFASAYEIPVLFICENNFFSSHMHIDLRQPANSMARFARAHEIPSEVVDGNDVVAVGRTTQKLLARARAGVGPGFLETVTYRWRGHVGPREDVDVGVKRKDDLAGWKRRDPIRRLMDALRVATILTDGDWKRMQREVQTIVDTECVRAIEAPYPGLEATLNLVYAQS